MCASRCRWTRARGWPPARRLRSLLLALALWIAADFLAALIWAGIFAIATWPLYVRFASRTFRKSTAYVPAAFGVHACSIGFTIFLPLGPGHLSNCAESELLLAWIAQSRDTRYPGVGMGCPATDSCKCNHRVVEGEFSDPKMAAKVVRNIQRQKIPPAGFGRSAASSPIA